MNLRPELQTPRLDEDLVRRLAELASRIDGARLGEADDELAEFNAAMGTSFDYDVFQGICGGEEHAVWVRRLLLNEKAPKVEDLSRSDLVAVFSRILSRDCSEADRDYLFATLKRSLDDPQITDLVYWPGEHFGDGNNARALTPDEMADAALAKRRERLGNG